MHEKTWRLHSKVFFDDLVSQLGHRPSRHDTAPVENREVVGEFLTKVKILLDQQDRHGSLGIEQAKRLGDLVLE